MKTRKTGSLSPENLNVSRASFFKSFYYAGQGVWYVIRTQRNMRVHLLAGIAVIVLGLVLQVSWMEWACLFITMALVYCLEMLNTVVEALVDMYTREFHPLAKIAKDVAAGAVLLASTFAVGVALVIFAPRLLRGIFGWSL
jgi:diacylglycerol kinase